MKPATARTNPIIRENFDLVEGKKSVLLFMVVTIVLNIQISYHVLNDRTGRDPPLKSNFIMLENWCLAEISHQGRLTSKHELRRS